MKKSRVLTFFIIGIQSIILHAEFFGGSIWTRKMDNGKIQHVVCLADDHQNNNGNDQQIEDFIRYMPKDSLIIIEGGIVIGSISSLSETDKNVIKSSSFLYLTDDILHPLKARLLQNNQHKMIDVEFRYDPLIGYVKRNSVAFNFCTVTEWLKRYVEKIEKWQQETIQHDDSPILNKNYNKLRRQMTKHIAFLKEIIPCFIQSCNNKQNSFDMPRLSFFNYSLQDRIINAISSELDIRILHQLHVNRDKEYICVGAGSAHIDNIEPVLFELGYRCQAQERNGFYMFGRPTRPINIKHFLAQLPVNENKSDKMTLNNPLAAACAAPILKYAPLQWTQWKRNAQQYKNPFLGFKQAAAQWFRKPTSSFIQFKNLSARLNAMPRCFKLGGLVATAGVSLMMGKK